MESAARLESFDFLQDRSLRWLGFGSWGLISKLGNNFQGFWSLSFLILSQSWCLTLPAANRCISSETFCFWYFYGEQVFPGFLSIHVYDVYNTDDKYKSVFIRNHWTTVRTENQLMQRMSMKYFNILVKNSFPRNSFNYINASNIISMNSTFIRIFFDSSDIRHKQIWDDYLFWS